MTMNKDIFPLETSPSCGKSAQVQLIQIESLLVQADMLSLAVIMYIVVTRTEVFKSFGWLNISGRYAKDTTNFSVSKCPAMPLPRCLRNCSMSLYSSNTSNHSNTG